MPRDCRQESHYNENKPEHNKTIETKWDSASNYIQIQTYLWTMNT